MLKIKVHESTQESGILDKITQDATRFNFELTKDNVRKVIKVIHDIYGNDVDIDFDTPSTGSSGYTYKLEGPSSYGFTFRISTDGAMQGVMYSNDGNERWKVQDMSELDDSLIAEIKAYNSNH